MFKFRLQQFAALLKRELIEHPGLFLWAPVLLAAVLLLASIWILSLAPGQEIAAGIDYLAVVFDGLSPVEMAPLFLLGAVPFIVLLYLCGIVYLLNALFQDRKDGSVLFWQSMPVSNTSTVLSKLATLAVVAPLCYASVMLVFYGVAVLGLGLLGMLHGAQVAGLGTLFAAAALSLLLMFFSVLSATLWLLPTVAWLLLFSAFAKRTPVMWAIGVFFLIGLLEDLLFNSQFLGNWVASRSDPNQYLITEFSSLFARFFNYEMVFGVLVGSILLVGAIHMRRFVD